jgi:oxygen-independent coproporphyrinogen-3 oxidase
MPFCETKCPYCDFNTYSGIEALMPTYIKALTKEINLWGRTLTEKGNQGNRRQLVATVFFGGGTPSYLPLEHIAAVMDAVRTSFSLSTDAEVSLESNPGDVTHDRLAAWKQSGINRLSIGVQSLDDDLLNLLGRRHNAQDAQNAYRATRSAGFDNVNLDLMYGLPRQTIDQWQATLSRTIQMIPAHLSLYCLTLEEGTPLEAWVRQGNVPEPDPDLAADMYLLAEEMASQAGYVQYEISNWSLPTRECRHNLIYWRNQPYLGVGPGAHSYMNGRRFSNLRSPRQYIQRMGDWTNLSGNPYDLTTFIEHGLVDMVEAIDPRLEMAESLMLGLRLNEGISEKEFRQHFGIDLRRAYQQEVEELTTFGLLQWEGDRLVLTQRGRLLGNEVFQRFLTEQPARSTSSPR